MEKYIITESQLKNAILKSMNESMKDENVAQKIGNGVNRLMNWGARKYGEAEQGINNLRNSMRKSYEAGKNAMRVKGLEMPHPAEFYREKYGDKFVEDMNRLGGFEPNGKPTYAKEQLLKTLNAYNVSQEDQAQILAKYGFTSGQQNTNTPQTSNGIEPQGCIAPEVTGQQNTAQQASQQTNQNNNRRVRQANSVSDLQARFNSPRGVRDVGTENAKLISAALGEYKKNHPEINEDVVREAVQNALKKYMDK